MATYRTVKNAADLPFTGVELVKVDKNITEIVIGGSLRVRSSDTFSRNLELLISAPFEEATRYRMTATVEGFDPKVSYHESEFDASQAGRDFEAKGATVTVEKVEVEIDGAGKVVEAGAAQPCELDALPF